MREINDVQEFDFLGTGDTVNVMCTNWSEFFSKIEVGRLHKFLKEFEDRDNFEMCAILRDQIAQR